VTKDPKATPEQRAQMVQQAIRDQWARQVPRVLVEIKVRSVTKDR
jgi:hypothetical protein